MAVPIRVTKQSPNQTLGMRNRGHIHTVATMQGTMNAIHIACTETSALVGGSQPTPLKMPHKRGMGRLANKVDAKTRLPTKTMLITNLVNTIQVVLLCEKGADLLVPRKQETLHYLLYGGEQKVRMLICEPSDHPLGSQGCLTGYDMSLVAGFRSTASATAIAAYA